MHYRDVGKHNVAALNRMESMKNLSRLRQAAGLTQHALGEIAKVPRSKIANVETGRAEFTDTEAERIRIALGKEVRENFKAISQSL